MTNQKIVPNSVNIGYVHPNIVTEGFARSLANLCLWEPNQIIGLTSASNPRQEVARNEAIKNFLKGPSEWFMWIDTDMTFYHDAIQKLRSTALEHKADMVGGLGFIYKRGPNEIIPNGYNFDEEKLYFAVIEDYESGKVYEIDGTGSGFILIHRRVFEAWDNEYWHQTWREHPVTGGPMGHDLAFCYQSVKVNGFKLLWDTGVKTGHTKYFELTEESYITYRESLT